MLFSKPMKMLASGNQASYNWSLDTGGQCFDKEALLRRGRLTVMKLARFKCLSAKGCERIRTAF